MEKECCAYLIQVGPKESKMTRKKINSSEFKIGRSKKANLCLTDVSVSRSHCVIWCSNNEWSLRNESQLGTIVGGKLIAENETCTLYNDNIIKLGPESEFMYKFCIETNVDEPPTKCPKIESCNSDIKPHNKEIIQIGDIAHKNLVNDEIQLKKQNEDLNSQLRKIIQEKEEVRLKYEEEKKRIENELLSEKNALEQRLKEMEDILSRKEKEQQTLNEKLKQTDEENVKLVALRRETSIQAETMVASLRNEVLTKELEMRETLEVEMKKLLDSRMQIEESIRVEKEQTEGSCAEKLKSLEEELSRVKYDFDNAEGKRQVLEKELEEAEKAKEMGTESALIAKHETLSEFANLIEIELQCSICNELFVKATTLNCTHTTCHYCLQEWKKKKNTCPMCRAVIVSENHSIVLDNFIDRIVENLSEEMRKRRLEIIEERKVLEVLSIKAPKKHGRKRKGTVNNASSNRFVMTVQPSTAAQRRSRQNQEIIVIGSEDEAYENPQGAPSQRYGGYGACFACGRRGHWAQGCPYN